MAIEAMPGPIKPEPEKEGGEERMKAVFETREGEKFSVEQLVSPEDFRVGEVQKLLVRTFGRAEVDPISVMREAMTGRMETGESVPRYLVNVAQDAEGKVVALATGAAVELVDADGEQSKSKALLLDAYTIVPPQLREKGVDEHLFTMREQIALQDARERGLEVAAYMVEAVASEPEDFYNEHGARRAYVQISSDHFVEVPYIQPPVDWDSKTGNPAEGAGTVPAHLMIKLFSGASELRGEDLMEMVRGMYLYNNYREKEYFVSKKAVRTHEAYIGAIEEKLAEAVAGQAVRLLSREEREAMVADGVAFEEHVK